MSCLRAGLTLLPAQLWFSAVTQCGAVRSSSPGSGSSLPDRARPQLQEQDGNPGSPR